jgi:hypothetical protein
MRDGGSELFKPNRRQFPENERRQATRDIRERVAVEEQEGRAAMVRAQFVQRLA